MIVRTRVKIVEIDLSHPANLNGVLWDLFTEYSSLTEEQVAASNKWYRTYPTKVYFRDNLQLDLEVLDISCTEPLWEKFCETHDEYPSEERGRPHAFLIMMKLLQNHTDSAIHYLIHSVKNPKISLFEGKDVRKVVSLIRGIDRRLKAVMTLPEEFPKWVLNVLQTSTVSKFNMAFSHLQRTIEVVDPMIKGNLKTKYSAIDNLVQSSENLYSALAQTNTWTGVKTKANQSGFVVKQDGNQKGFCWNCGQEGHMLKDCTRVVSQSSIDARKKAFKEAKTKAKKAKQDGKKDDEKKETPRTGKWAPPQPNERNKRAINGKPMFWHFKTQRWVEEKKAGANQAAVAQQSVPPSTTPTTALSSIPSNDSERVGRDLAMANASHQVKLAMKGLLNAFKES
jgi:Zinc knuckle